MKCKDQAGLHKEMARVYEMCKGTKYEGKEYLCVKHDGHICEYSPLLTSLPESYEFALGIVEDKLVWEGDKLWDSVSRRYLTIAGVCQDIDTLITIEQGATYIKQFSWNPPAPPKPKTVSISVNGGEAIELVLPDEDETLFRIGSFPYVGGWRSFKDFDSMLNFIRNLLEGKL